MEKQNDLFREAVGSPDALKAIPKKQIPELCAQIRAELIRQVSRTGGHLASNLGVTELTVAIHRVFSSPADHILFDVGHQSYVHKMLTGRADRMETLRTPGGLSGFTSRKESPHDPFGAGHSSTALSAGLGFAEADRMDGREAYTVVVMGDGAFSGGMVHEALNNIRADDRLVIILNENRMSISRTRGRFSSYLARVRISKGYLCWKKNTKSFLAKLPLLGKPMTRFLSFVKGGLKNILYTENYFEQLGLYYIGPVDGNDFAAIERALIQAKRLEKPVLIHAFTVKGKGYPPAEKDPSAYHNIPPEGEKTPSPPFHAVMAEELVALGKTDPSVIAITAAMGEGTGLSEFEKVFPERYYDVGIAEPHALTFAAGLAASGKKPFAAIYSTFLQRGYDQILHDIALQDLPVRILIDRAGLAPRDGATHHGIFDVAFLSGIPGVRILSPITAEDLRAAIRFAAAYDHPIAVRYPNAGEDLRALSLTPERRDGVTVLRADIRPGEAKEAILIGYGANVSRIFGAEEILNGQGADCGAVLLGALAPYEATADVLLPYLSGAKKILFVEEGVREGGAGMLLLDRLLRVDPGFASRFEILALASPFLAPEEISDLDDLQGISPEKIAAHILQDRNVNHENDNRI